MLRHRASRVQVTTCRGETTLRSQSAQWLMECLGTLFVGLGVETDGKMFLSRRFPSAPVPRARGPIYHRLGQTSAEKMAQYHAGRGKKQVVLDGRNPADILAWEGYIYNVIKEKHGDIGVEHWRGRHPYTLSEAGGDEGVRAEA